MFDIEYKGGNCVIISTKKTTLVVDPKLSVVGLKDIKTTDQIELATEARFVVANSDARLIIDRPGEYEVGDFTVRGIGAIRHIDTEKDAKLATIYRVEVGDARIAIIGNIAPALTDDQLEGLGVVDVLVIPVGGGGYTLDATSAAAIVRQVEPKVVVPIHHADPALKYEVPQEGLEVFAKELAAPVEVTTKYKVKSAAALPAVMTLVELTRS